ncbi:MAG: DHA2 family efflux MFS transporter permease subunit [Microcystaceae cyanobacterium]
MKPSSDSLAPVPSKWLALIGVCLGVMMYTLDGSIVNIAVPTFLRVFRTDFVTVQWVIIGYLLVIICGLLAIARLAEVVGQKRIFLIGLGLFTLGSLLCGLSPNIYSLIAFRIVQGLGAVCMAALMSATVVSTFPSHQLGQALGIVTMAATLGTSLGPSLGGFLIATWSWRGIFLVNLPLGLFAIFLVSKTLPQQPFLKVPRLRFDWAGFLLMTVGFISLLLVILQEDHTLVLRIGYGALSAIAFLSFGIVEYRSSLPLLDLRIFQTPAVTLGLLGRFLSMVINAGYLFMTPLFLEWVLNYSPKQTGLLLTTTPIIVGITAPIFGKLSDRYGSTYFNLAGLMGMAIALGIMSRFSPGMTSLEFMLSVAPWGLGLGMFNAPNNSIIMKSVSPEHHNLASALLSLSIMLGQALGVSVLGASFHYFARQASPNVLEQSLTQLPPTAIAAGITQTFLLALLPVIVLILLNLRWQFSKKLDS